MAKEEENKETFIRIRRFFINTVLCGICIFHFLSQDYVSMVQDLEQERVSAGSDVMLAKLREKLREKEKALEVLLSFRLFYTYKQTLVYNEGYISNSLQAYFFFFYVFFLYV